MGFRRTAKKADMNRPGRVLMIARNFPPMTGGLERLTYHAYLELLKEFELMLLAPKGSERFTREDGEIARCPTEPLAAFLACLHWKAYRLAKRLAPDLIIASSGVSAPAAYWAGRAAKVPVLCCVAGLDIVAPSWIYQTFFVPAIRQCDAIVAISQNTADLASSAGVPRSRISILHPGVTLPDGMRLSHNEGFRARYGLEHCKVLLSVGRLLPRKGLPEFIRHVMPLLVSRRNDVVLAIIGEEPRQALAARSGEIRRIKEAASLVEVSKQVVLIGSVNDAILRQAYFESDLMVFPVRNMPGDVEGFGMVALEAAAHGLPTAAFSSGGVADAVGDGVSGYLVAPEDFDGLAQVILRHLEGSDREDWRHRCVEHAKQFSWESYGIRLRKICLEVIEKRVKASIC